MKPQSTRLPCHTTNFLYACVVSGLTFCLPANGMTAQKTSKALETVHGTGCYNFDGEATLAKARRAATAIAQEQAVRSHHVFVDSSARVKDFQLEEDVIQTTSAAMLYEIKIEKEERKAQEICIILTAKISPVSMEDMIRQQIAAKEIAQDAQGALVPDNPAFGLKVWTNKAEGRFLEGEKLVIYVQSDRDAYLKLDYFQADGTVVHLVPNVYRGQAFIKGGKKYAFGDETSPEHFVIKGPYGAEVIKGIVSVRPFELSLDTGEAVSDSRTYLNGIRGLKVVAASAAVELKTESHAVSDYKKGNAKPWAPEKHP